MTQGQIAGGDEDRGKEAADGLEPVFPPRSSPDPRTVTGLWYVATGRYGNRGRTPGYWSRLWDALRGRSAASPTPAPAAAPAQEGPRGKPFTPGDKPPAWAWGYHIAKALLGVVPIFLYIAAMLLARKCGVEVPKGLSP